jgi:hypothetical protein
MRNDELKQAAFNSSFINQHSSFEVTNGSESECEILTRVGAEGAARR